MMNTIRKAVGHFNTITKHRHKVMAHCAKAGIFWQGLKHDLSKYSPTEFISSVKHYTGKRSPNEGEREEQGYSLAWMHHKGRNRHHFEYWTDYNIKEGRAMPVPMPYKYVVEMFCDRLAASKVYNGKNYKQTDPLEYFLKRKSARVIYKETGDQIEELLRMLAEKGEAETFKYIKEKLRKGKNE